MLRRTRLLIVTGILLGLALVSGGMLFSLWLPWHLLPAANWRLAWTPALHHLVATLPIVPPGIEQADGPPKQPWDEPRPEFYLGGQAWLAAYAKGTGETLVLLPRVSKQLSARRQLAADGWQVQRLGPYLYAERGSGPLTRDAFIEAAKGFVQTFLTSRWPLWPAAVSDLRAGTTRIDEPLLVVASRHGREVRVVVAATTGSPRASERLLAPPADQAVISAAGSLWGSEGVVLWNELLWRNFQFTHTRPAIQQQLAQFERATFVTHGADHAALVVTDETDQFSLAATTWVQEEDRRTRLVNRAFRLPDGTIGYERIPGESLPVWTEADTAGCRGPLEQRTALWLCIADDRTALGTSKDIALQGLAQSPTGALNLQLGQGALNQLGLGCGEPGRGALNQLLCQVHWIHWQATAEQQMGYFELK